MASNVVVPTLGESIVEATVARWLKHEGEPVATGEPLVELETDKVNLDVGAEQNGVLVKITHKEGEDVKVGDVLGVIDEKAAVSPPTEPKSPGGTKRAASKDQDGSSVVAVPAQIEPAQTAPPSSAPIPVPVPERTEPERVTPVARRVAEEHGINPTQLTPSKPGARVTRQDVENYLIHQDEAPAQPAAPSIQPPGPAPRPALNTDREERVLMTRRRRTIAQRMLEATQTTAMLTTFNEVDMDAVMQIRKRRKEEFKERFGVGLGSVSFFVKASISALREFPMLNAEIEGDEVIYKHYYDIGVAVGATEGLVVPVLRDADRMSFPDIEKTLLGLVEKSRNNTLSLEDLRGGTFTITNGGVFGSLLSTPILNPPQVGILGIHKIEERPVASAGQVVIRPMMYVALSYDHRLVDGREAVQFLVRIKQIIENPEIILLES